jgi:hypothetical protein
MSVIVIVIIAIVVIVASSFTLRVSRLGRRKEVAADEALRKLYRRYWAEARALAHEHLTTSPSDEEWLADIRARASAPADRRPLTSDSPEASRQIPQYPAQSWPKSRLLRPAIAVPVVVSSYLFQQASAGAFLLAVLIIILTVGAVVCTCLFASPAGSERAFRLLRCLGNRPELPEIFPQARHPREPID